MPRDLRDHELSAIVAGFRLAARHAMAAGFDGVEIHGANGYLLDEFLRDGSNQRSGPYGGPVEHWARLPLEVLEAVAQETTLMGLCLSPLNSYNAMADSDPIGLITWLAKRRNDLPLAYLHLMRASTATACSWPPWATAQTRPTPPSPPARSMRWPSGRASWPIRICRLHR